MDSSKRVLAINCAIIVGLMTLLFFFNLPIIEDLRLFSFDDGTYSHAYLIPIVVIYLVYDAVATDKIEWRQSSNFVILGALAISCLLFVWFYTAQVAFIFRVIFPLLVILFLLTMFRFSLQVVVPATVLWFMFPVWGLLSPVLQQLSVSAVTFVMSLTGIPVYVEGTFVHIPAGTFEIANGCSGLRYFIVSLMVCLLFAYMNIKRIKDALVFVSLAIIGALLVNWIRITFLILVGHFSDMESDLMKDHNMLGWYLYIPYLFLLMRFGRRYEAEPERADDIKPLIGNIKIAIAPTLIVFLFSSNSVWWLTRNATFSHTELSQAWKPKSALGLMPRVDILHPAQYWELSNASQQVDFAIFSFLGRNEMDRASYFKIRTLPEYWSSDDSYVYADKTVQVARSVTGDRALIVNWYSYNGSQYPSRSALRLARLKSIMHLNRVTEFNWLLVRCATSCDKEQQSLDKFLPL